MLTDSEKKWLWRRELSPYRYCIHCRHRQLCKNYDFIIGVCPTLRHPEDWQDAVEFSERVAVKLAEKVFLPYDKRYPCAHGAPADGCMRDKTWLTGPYAVHCEDCILKYARLAVEEEDAD